MLVWGCVGSAGWARAADDFSFFETRIRPVLVKHCYECHATGSGKAEGQLILDHREALRRGGESGPAVVPGNPAESLLWQALRHEGLKMPPAGRLPESTLADFERWIREGALDPRDQPPSPREVAREAWQAKLAERRQWWSLQAPRWVVPPQVDEPRWSRHEVDRFIWSRLAAERLSPAPPADPQTLLRRLSFVLTGLPPTPDQLAAFRQAYEQDAEGALERLVDQLLASPHFGERFARHWMDVVRYTDTYGYEWDNPAKGSWEYRDYLIRAFNQDVGFDQLIREQLAGDLLAAPRMDPVTKLNESLIGPFFYHMGEHRHGASLDFNGIHQEMIDNKIDAFSKAFLGLTIACARCHDHKLDAVSQADYYALAGVFMTPRWTARDLAATEKDAELVAELKRLRGEIRQAVAQSWSAHLARAARPLGGESLRTWARAHQAELMTARSDSIAFPLAQLVRSDVWLPVRAVTAKATEAETRLQVGEEHKVLAEGPVPQTDTYTVEFTSGPGTASFLRLEALPHPSLGGGGPGRTPHGNFVLTHIRIQVQPLAEPAAAAPAAAAPAAAAPAAAAPAEQQTPPAASSAAIKATVEGPSREVKLSGAIADFSQAGYPVSAALDPSPQSGWGVGGVSPINVARTARFQFAEPVRLPHGGRWIVTLEHRYGSQHTLGHFRLTPGGDAFEQPTKNSTNLSPNSNADAAPQADAGQDATTELRTRWQQLAQEWTGLHDQRRKANASRFTIISELNTPELPAGWLLDGQGFAHGHVTDGTPRIDLTGQSLIAEFLPRGLHSHALSSKLAGAIRLPPAESWPKKRISLRIAGGEWAGRIDVPQNAFQTESITFFDGPNTAGWQSVSPVTLKNGVTRVLTEFSTASLHPNFPPRTGLARAGSRRLPDDDFGYDKRSWLSVTQIVASDEGGVPEETLEPFASLYASKDRPGLPQSSIEVWERLASWLSGAVERWIEDRTTAADLPILNWLLQNQLLPNDASSLPEAARLVEAYRRTEARLEFARTSISMDERNVEPIDYRLNIRGNVDDEGDAIPRGFLELFWNHDPAAADRGRVPYGIESAANGATDPASTQQLITVSTTADGNLPANSASRLSASVSTAASPALIRWTGRPLADGGSGRIELAEFLTRFDQPLTARVYVNRVWAWVFGTGLVNTPNDFGKLGDRPSHPELLDWLAIRFTQENWSTKQLVRHLVLSQTFRQSGQVDSRAAERDPQNRLLHHYPTRRLEAESIRDSLLFVSGRFDPRLYGRPINPPRVAQDGAKRLYSGPWDSNGRRSIYITMSIMEPPKFLVGFNLPDLKLPTGRRDQTNVPAQSLIMLNDPLVNRLAEHWASHLTHDGCTTPAERIAHMFLIGLGREAQPAELERWTRAATSFSNSPSELMQDQKIWQELAHALFNTQEFLHYR